MLFSDIIGQQHIKARFIKSVKEQRIPHAQLICGGNGHGKRALAMAYAQYICCENKGENDSCGSCSSCLKFAKLAHPDLHLVFPVVKPSGKDQVVSDDFVTQFRESFIENPYFSESSWFEKIGGSGKQGMIYSNESSEIIRKLSLKTYESEYKIMFIWQPEKMHNSCANKLLKILEEPPAKTIFLLVSDAPDTIISTIQSRAQRINVPPIETEYISNAIFEKYQLAVSDAQHIARIANGNFIKATHTAEKEELNKQNLENFVFLMRTTWGIKFFNTKSKKGQALKELRAFCDTMAKAGREKQKSFLAFAQYMIRENFMCNFHQKELNYLSAEETVFSEKFAPYINETNVIGMMEEFALAETHIEQNVQPRIVFFDLSLKVILLLKN